MSSINDCRTVHDYLEKYFQVTEEDGEKEKAEKIQHIQTIEQKITSEVKEVFAKNEANTEFQLAVSATEFPLLRQGNIKKAFGVAITELYPECSYTVEPFVPRGGNFIAQSCLFTIKRESKL